MNSLVAIPGETGCLALLRKHRTPDHIIRHCQMVWEVGRFLGESLVRENLHVDMLLLRASCLLHDIGKYPCILSGAKNHDVLGEQILEQEGLLNVGRIVSQHVILRSQKNRPIGEEHIVFYADKRVIHDEIVSLENRFTYLTNTYGKTAQARDRLLIMKQETIDVETAIFENLTFGPEEISKLSTTI
ncbi:MAG: HD domain-containing protein [Deltaproteobacteria bacterium]|nr:HD domain-containing protein [Deltaproteobacteria bacterium]